MSGHRTFLVFHRAALCAAPHSNPLSPGRTLLISSVKAPPRVREGAAPLSTFLVIIAAGKFHGVTSEHTPTPCLVTRMRLFPFGGGSMLPSIRLTSSAKNSTNDAAYATSPLASASGLPHSLVIITATAAGGFQCHKYLLHWGRLLQEPGQIALWDAATRPRTARGLVSETSHFGKLRQPRSAGPECRPGPWELGPGRG